MTSKQSIITAYLINGTTDLSQDNVNKIIIYANNNFMKFDDEYLQRLKTNYEARLAKGDYEGGCEMPGPNNYWAGNGQKHKAVSIFHDNTSHNSFIYENFPNNNLFDVQTVLACEVFKILCPHATNEDQGWFIRNLSRVI